MATTSKYYDEDAFNNAAAKIGYGQEAPTYAGTFENQLNDIYNQIANREKFSYDVNADPLYDMYKDKYIQQGKLAMKDTMGQAAALTGGYGSSYAQQVGQQTYDAYLQSLSDVIPELYGMAYSQYQDEGDRLNNLYGMAGKQREAEYNQYRDAMQDYNVNRELVRQQEETDYNRRLAEDELAWTRQQQEQETAFNQQKTYYSNLYAAILASGYTPTDQELTAAGMSRELADALKNMWARNNVQPVYSGGMDSVSAPSGGGSSGSGKKSSGGGSSGGGGNTLNNYSAPTSGSAGFTVDRNGDLIYTGTADQYNSLSSSTKQAAAAAVQAQESGKSMTEYYKKKYGL